MRRRTSGLVVLLACLLSPASSAGAAALLRLDGIRPLKLGMVRAAAVNTGWLALVTRDRSTPAPRSPRSR